jgi:hypothetical protein
MMKGSGDDAQYGPWLRVSLGGSRRNKGGDCRREGAWRSNALVRGKSIGLHR